MRALAGLLPVGAVLAASSASAQDPGSRIQRYAPAAVNDNVRLTPSERAQVTMNRYSACIVQRSRRVAERLIATAPGSTDEAAAVRSFAVPDCLQEGELRFQPFLMRGGVFEAMYRADYARTPAHGIAERAVIRYAGYAPELATPAQRQRAAMLQFADCVTRANPTGAHALVLSPVASKQENAALAGLQPALGACLPSGDTLRFSRIVLRGMVAETAYRLSRAPAASAPGTTK